MPADLPAAADFPEVAELAEAAQAAAVISKAGLPVISGAAAAVVSGAVITAAGVIMAAAIDIIGVGARSDSTSAHLMFTPLDTTMRIQVIAVRPDTTMRGDIGGCIRGAMSIPIILTMDIS